MDIIQVSVCYETVPYMFGDPFIFFLFNFSWYGGTSRMMYLGKTKLAIQCENTGSVGTFGFFFLLHFLV